MRFVEELVEGRLVKRYKRFLADVLLPDGTLITAHCANPGRMTGCDRPHSRVVLSRSTNLKRKLPWSLELVRVGRTWVGVNTLRANSVVEEALQLQRIGELQGATSLQREPRVSPHRRLDFLLQIKNQQCFVEVKNVTLKDGVMAQFPDAVTARGAQHLRELSRLAQGGHRAVLLFFVNRQDCQELEVAGHIDPEYAECMTQALQLGVEVLAYQGKVGKRGISLSHSLPFRSPAVPSTP